MKMKNTDAEAPWKKRPRPSRNWGAPRMWRKRYGRVPGHSSARRCRITACQNRAADAEKSPCGLCWLSLFAILIVVLLVFIGSFKIVTKYQYSIAESATAEEVPPQETTGGATENMDESTDENTETAITKGKCKKRKHQSVGKQHDDAVCKAGPNDGTGPGLR